MRRDLRGRGHWLSSAAGLFVVMLAGCTSANPAVPASTSATVRAAALLEDFTVRAAEQGASAVILHIRDGEQETAKAFGVRDHKSERAADVADRLWISGAGTSMLAVSVMKLVEEDRVKLDDPAADILPEFPAIFPGWSRTTVRELLGSRTGLPDYVPPLLASMPPEKLQTTVLTFEERLRLAAAVRAEPAAVLEATWSATDWEVLGWIVERLRGKSLADVLRTDVFEPAGMTTALLPGPGQPPEPMLHASVRSGDTRLDFTRIDAITGSGDAGIVSSVIDVDRFLAGLTTGRLVRAGTWQQMAGGNPYNLGVNTAENICPGMKHVLASGGGGPYAIHSATTTDGRQQVSVAMVLPPASLDSTNIPLLVRQMEGALRAAAAELCS